MSQEGGHPVMVGGVGRDLHHHQQAGSSSSRSWNISKVIRPACGCLMRILAGLKYRTGYSAHQSRNCGLASVSAATGSANRGSPGCPAAAWNWLSRTRAARS